MCGGGGVQVGMCVLEVGLLREAECGLYRGCVCVRVHNQQLENLTFYQILFRVLSNKRPLPQLQRI